MNIGIITTQDSINFGAQLQCFALQETLKQLGHNPEIIKYKYVRKAPVYRCLDIKGNGVSGALKLLISRLRFNNRIANKFAKFRNKYLNLSKECDAANIAAVANNYDAIITGSDQVWVWHFHNTEPFFIDWKPEFKGRKISYAVCSAKNYYEQKNKETLKRKISAFNSISVRDNETYEFVEELTAIKPQVVADPTILYHFNNIDTSKYDNDDYILLYILGSEVKGGHDKILEQIYKAYGKHKIYAVFGSIINQEVCAIADKCIFDADPIEWLSLIKNAKFVYTDSFHSTIFSIKYERPFLTYFVEEDRAGRLLDMTERYNLSKNIVSSVDDALAKGSIIDKTDFELIKKAFDNHKSVSIEFLKEALA